MTSKKCQSTHVRISVYAAAFFGQKVFWASVRHVGSNGKIHTTIPCADRLQAGRAAVFWSVLQQKDLCEIEYFAE
ncbi:hypothetical protein [Ramlibacter sp. Leaf400]|uniref:hypothetical protein n=1 Tax=Ramlibacter sp. Leaf400 TaxID=1736365 RepID=UPI0012E35CE5|nr:hypothetical protein [Ramlibacter sp. Leaf400]